MSANESPTEVTPLGDLVAGAKTAGRCCALRTVATVALMLVLYFLLPLGGGTSAEKVIKLTLGALALVAIIIWQVRQIVRSDHPVDRAVEALGVQSFRSTCCSLRRPTS